MKTPTEVAKDVFGEMVCEHYERDTCEKIIEKAIREARLQGATWIIERSKYVNIAGGLLSSKTEQIDQCLLRLANQEFGTKFPSQYENMTKYMPRVSGKCATCERDQPWLCEHGHCPFCGCGHYCWLD